MKNSIEFPKFPTLKIINVGGFPAVDWRIPYRYSQLTEGEKRYLLKRYGQRYHFCFLVVTTSGEDYYAITLGERKDFFL